MNEIYSETYVKAKPSLNRYLLRYGLVALAVILFLAVVFVLHQPFLAFVVVLVDGIIIYFLPTTDIAYEYIFVDGQIDFDCIYKASRRKTMLRTDMEKVEIVAVEDSHTLDAFMKLPIQDFSSGFENDKNYVMVCRLEKGDCRVKFTPDQAMIDNIKMKSRSKLVEQ